MWPSSASISRGAALVEGAQQVLACPRGRVSLDRGGRAHEVDEHYLEEKYPDRPALFGDESARATTRFVNIWSDTVLMPMIRRVISADFLEVLAPEDRAYFRTSREAAFGQTLEAAAAARPELLAQLEAAWLPMERLLGEQEFVCGREPRYADYIFFSVLQWARLGSPQDIVKPATSIARWRSRMSVLFDGLADKFPSYPTKRH